MFSRISDPIIAFRGTYAPTAYRKKTFLGAISFQCLSSGSDGRYPRSSADILLIEKCSIFATTIILYKRIVRAQQVRFAEVGVSNAMYEAVNALPHVSRLPQQTQNCMAVTYSSSHQQSARLSVTYVAWLRSPSVSHSYF